MENELIKTLIKVLMAGSLAMLGLIFREKIFDLETIDGGLLLAIAVLLLTSFFGIISLLVYREHKDFVDKSWLAAMSSLFAFLIGDLVAGYLLIDHTSILLRDPYVHHRLKPNTVSRFTSPDFSYVLTTNNLGLRGPEISLVKSEDTFRILMLGDSFTMGKGVNDDETFSFLLEASLRAKGVRINGRIPEVVNAGVDSYTPLLEYLQLTRELGQIDPDLIVLNFDMSDLIQEDSYRRAAAFEDDGGILEVTFPEDKSLGLLTRVRYWIDRNLYLSRLALFRLDRLGGPPEPTIGNTVTLSNPELLRHTLADDSMDRAAQWRNVFDSIARVKTYCDDHRSDFLLTVYPWGHQVNEREWATGRREFIPDAAVLSDKSIHTVLNFAESRNIELLNVFDEFRSYTGPDALYFKHDIHWTPHGHKLMADALGTYLLSRYSSVSSRPEVGKQ